MQRSEEQHFQSTRNSTAVRTKREKFKCEIRRSVIQKKFAQIRSQNLREQQERYRRQQHQMYRPYHSNSPFSYSDFQQQKQRHNNFHSQHPHFDNNLELKYGGSSMNNGAIQEYVEGQKHEILLNCLDLEENVKKGDANEMLNNVKYYYDTLRIILRYCKEKGCSVEIVLGEIVEFLFLGSEKQQYSQGGRIYRGLIGVVLMMDESLSNNYHSGLENGLAQDWTKTSAQSSTASIRRSILKQCLNTFALIFEEIVAPTLHYNPWIFNDPLSYGSQQRSIPIILQVFFGGQRFQSIMPKDRYPHSMHLFPMDQFQHMLFICLKELENEDVKYLMRIFSIYKTLYKIMPLNSSDDQDSWDFELFFGEALQKKNWSPSNAYSISKNSYSGAIDSKSSNDPHCISCSLKLKWIGVGDMAYVLTNTLQKIYQHRQHQQHKDTFSDDNRNRNDLLEIQQSTSLEQSGNYCNSLQHSHETANKYQESLTELIRSICEIFSLYMEELKEILDYGSKLQNKNGRGFLAEPEGSANQGLGTSVTHREQKMLHILRVKTASAVQRRKQKDQSKAQSPMTKTSTASFYPQLNLSFALDKNQQIVFTEALHFLWHEYQHYFFNAHSYESMLELSEVLEWVVQEYDLIGHIAEKNYKYMKLMEELMEVLRMVQQRSDYQTGHDEWISADGQLSHEVENRLRVNILLMIDRLVYFDDQFGRVWARDNRLVTLLIGNINRVINGRKRQQSLDQNGDQCGWSTQHINVIQSILSNCLFIYGAREEVENHISEILLCLSGDSAVYHVAVLKIIHNYFYMRNYEVKTPTDEMVLGYMFNCHYGSVRAYLQEEIELECLIVSKIFQQCGWEDGEMKRLQFGGDIIEMVPRKTYEGWLTMEGNQTMPENRFVDQIENILLMVEKYEDLLNFGNVALSLNIEGKGMMADRNGMLE